MRYLRRVHTERNPHVNINKAINRVNAMMPYAMGGICISTTASPAANNELLMNFLSRVKARLQTGYVQSATKIGGKQNLGPLIDGRVHHLPRSTTSWSTPPAPSVP